MPAKKKHTVYIPDEIYDEMELASDRLDRSVSWLVIHAWKLSRETILGYPAMNDGAIADRAQSVH